VYRLENDRLKIEVIEKGAELQSIVDKQSNREWLWQGDSKWWGKRSPILFPFVGALKEGCYRYEGQTYSMTKHGFARDLDFTCESVTDNALIFVLRHSAKTLEMYPFEFELRITYQLEIAALAVTYEVVNLGDVPMYFSLGGHPAFNCPMDEACWTLAFEHAETLESYCIDLASGLILPHKKSLPTDGKPLTLKSDLFEEDALVFEGLVSKAVTLTGPSREESFQFKFEGFELFALWSPKGPFLCLEPWVGMADFKEASGELTEKYGVLKLEARESYRCGYEVVLG
jgi:galactose mutarotase-like enzyme